MGLWAGLFGGRLMLKKCSYYCDSTVGHCDLYLQHQMHFFVGRVE